MKVVDEMNPTLRWHQNRRFFNSKLDFVFEFELDKKPY